MHHQPRLIANERGPLRVWQPPEQGRVYAIGADAASGMRSGDWCAAEVIDTETCTQVAEYQGKIDPVPFGQQIALLAQHYNEAFLGFEVYPSAHGLAAQNAAIQMGYRRLYRESAFDKIDRKVSERIGWRTDVRTKALMVDRVRIALLDGYRINSSSLVREIRGMKFDDAHRPYTEGHDDLHDAYAIALMVRDTAYRQGQIEEAPPKPKSWLELHWDGFDASTGGSPSSGAREQGCWDGR